MATFQYKAYTAGRELKSGAIEAETSAKASQALRNQGLFPISVRSEGVSGDALSISDRIFGPPKPTMQDILFFIRNISATLSAGMTVLAGLEIMARDTTRKSVYHMVIGLERAVRGGATLRDAFVPFREYFNPAFIGMVHAGEASGRLTETFKLLAEYIRRDFALRAKVKSAMLYPLILISATVLIVSILLIFVVPRIAVSFLESGTALPLPTRIVLGVSDFLRYSVTLDVLAVLGVYFGWKYFVHTPRGRRWLGEVLSRTPAVKYLIRDIVLVRYCRTLGNLMTTSMPILDALEITKESVAHPRMEYAIDDFIDRMQQGASLSSCMEDYPELFVPVVVGLVQVGEESGKTGESLLGVADFYDDEVQYTLQTVTTMIEPFILLFMGVVVGIIAASILMPIYELATSIS